MPDAVPGPAAVTGGTPISAGTSVAGAAGQAAPGPGSEPEAGAADWVGLLAAEAARRLITAHGQPLPPAGEGLMNELTRRFEATLIRAALQHTGGRRVEASLRLGIGRNTLTRKIQELGLDDL